MPIIPKIGGKGDGLIRGAVSTASGNLGQQIKGVAAREAGALRSGSALGQVGRVVDLRTGGLLTSGKELLGIARGGAGETGSLEGTAQSRRDPPLNSSTLPQWGHLSEHLFARIFPCDSKGVEITDPTKAAVGAILAPATEVQFESTLNWQSPFENSGPESKAPTVMALLQTGQIATVANDLQSQLKDVPIFGKFLSSGIESAGQFAKSLEGKTGITKLNSRQVFSGMPPIRITLQLHLRAVSDAEAEVMAPYQKLLMWAWPQMLADNGIISEIITTGNLIRGMFPSDAPQMVGFKYGNNRYMPMVIESVGNQLDGPMDSNGTPIYRSVAITLATLTALDRNDVPDIFSRS